MRFAVSVLSSLLGLLMCFAPESFIKVAVILGGIAAIISGLFKITTLSLWAESRRFRRAMLCEGILGIIVGVLAVVLPLDVFNTVWILFLYILGAYMVLVVILTLTEIVQLRKSFGADYKIKSKVIEIVCYAVFAAVVFIIPGSIGTALIQIIGLSLAVFGLGVFIYQVKYGSQNYVVTEFEATVTREEPDFK